MIYIGKKFAVNLHNLEVPDSPNKWEAYSVAIAMASLKCLFTYWVPKWLYSYKITLILKAGSVTLYSIILILFVFVDNFSPAKSKIQQQKGCASVKVSSLQTTKRQQFRDRSSWHGPGLWYSHSAFFFSLGSTFIFKITCSELKCES